MSKWEQNAVFEYSEYICLVKRINGIVAQKTLVTELVRCKECKWADKCSQNVAILETYDMYEKLDFCSHGERKESE